MTVVELDRPVEEPERTLTPTELKAADVLRAAREIVADRWAQGMDVMYTGGPTCAGLALTRAYQGEETAVAETALGAFTAAAGIPFDRVVGWNDHPDRTQEEVVAAFDRAIALVS